MSILVISDPSQNPNRETILEANRRSANFHPSIWGDQFLTCAPISNLVHLFTFVYMFVQIFNFEENLPSRIWPNFIISTDSSFNII